VDDDPVHPELQGATVVNRGVRLAWHQEPEHLNPYIFTHGAAGEITVFMCEGLLDYDTDSGSYYTRLAEDIPTVANGLVADDGRTVRYRLRPNLRWSDGRPLTSDDVRFTWEAITHAESPATGTAGYTSIERIDCPDERTVVLHFAEPYAPYLTLFPCVLPRHATGDPADMANWQFNDHPIGPGAFRLREWARGERIVMEANPYYRGQPAKPALSSVTIQFVPDRETALELLASGEIDATWNMLEAFMPRLSQLPGIRIIGGPGPAAERLVLNQAHPDWRTTSAADVQAHPHPALSDLKTRTAIELAIDKPRIVKELLHSLAEVGTNELHAGWAACPTKPSEYAPHVAAKLLDEAGWTRGPDGIRIATSAAHAEPGSRLSIRLAITEANVVRRKTAEMVCADLRDVGMEVRVVEAPAHVMFSTSPSSPYRVGQFDMCMFAFGPEMDPHPQISELFTSQGIPSIANHYRGLNISRWVSATADECVERAGSSLDLGERRAAYHKLMIELTEQRPQIYLYNRATIYAHREELVGPVSNVWEYLGWNAAEWRWNSP
jgi:peptide/nickel transport system substrate-binding protein